MRTAGDTFLSWEWGHNRLLWAGCLVVVLGVHAGVLTVLLDRALPPPVEVAPAPEAVMLDLPPDLPLPAPPEPAASEAAAPVPPAPTPPLPEPPPPELPPEPPPPEPPPPEPPPVPPPPELPVLPAPEVVMPVAPPPPPKPVRVRPPAPHPVSRPSPPRPAVPEPATASASPPAIPAAPASAAPPAPPSNAVPTWRGELLAKLLRAKRYPDAARFRGEQGTAYATFTMDRGGHVVSASVSRGSGSSQLDEEAVALIHRAEPLPPMPAEMPGATVTLTVPVSFTLR